MNSRGWRVMACFIGVFKAFRLRTTSVKTGVS